MTYINIDDHRLFYTDDAAGDQAPPLPHGATCDSHDRSWRIDPFAADHRMITPDLRGHGRSSEIQRTGARLDGRAVLLTFSPASFQDVRHVSAIVLPTPPRSPAPARSLPR